MTKEQLVSAARELARRYHTPRYDLTDDSINTPAALKDSNRLVIEVNHSDYTMYDSPGLNWEYRAHHDTIHLNYELGFSLAEETENVRIGIRQLGLHTQPLLADLYWIDGVGQQLYYYTHGHFPVDQLQFVLDELNGVTQLCRKQS